MSEEANEETPPQTADADIESGIFNLVVSLVQYRAPTLGMPTACAQVAGYLEYIATTLRTMDGDQEHGS